MTTKNFIRTTLILAVCAIPFIYNACALEGDHTEGSANSASVNECTDILAEGFRSSFYPFVKAKCGDCHNGSQAAPPFAHPDFAKAFAIFNDKGAEKISQFATSSHKPGYTGPELQPDVDAANAAYAPAQDEYIACQIEKSKPPVGGGKIAVPNKFTISKQANPAANTSVILTWNTGTEMESPANAYAGGTFEIRVRAFDTGAGATGYEFYSPRLTNAGSTAAYVRGLAVKVNGIIVPGGNTFYVSDRYVSNVTGNNVRRVDKNGGVILLSSLIGTAINVQVGFTELRSAGIDFQPPLYTALSAAGGIFNTSCFGCHGTDGGFSIQNYNNLIGRLGSSGKTLVVPYNPGVSQIYIRSSDVNTGIMPPAGILPTASVERIRDWILDGAYNTAGERTNQNNMAP